MADSFNPDEYLKEKAAANVQANSFDPDKYLAEKQQANHGYDLAGAPGRILRSASESARSGLEAMTLGASEPVISGVNAAIETASGGKPSLDELKKNYENDVERRRQFKQKAPISDIGGQLLGYAAPVGPAAYVGGKVAGLVGKGAQAVLPEVAPAASKLGQAATNLYGNAANAATGAAEGAAGAVAQEIPRRAIEGTTGFIKKDDTNVPDLGSVAATGGAIGGGISALGTVARGLGATASKGGKMLMSAFLGPSEQHINYYLEHPEAVNGAKSIEELKDKVDGITDSLREDVQNGSKSVDDAKSDLKDVESAIADHRRQSNYDYQVTATQVKQSFRDAKNDLDNAFENKVRDLKSIKPPTDLADEATQAVKDLKGKVVEGSNAATDTLGTDGGHVETFSPYQTLKAAKDRLSIAGRGPVTPQAKAAAAQIDGLMATFGSLPGHLSFGETKSLIKQLDQSEQAIYNSGEFTDDVARSYKTLRGQLDTQLKAQNPQYAEAMKPVAENAKLHSDVAPAFGDRASAISKLNSIASPTSQVNRENLIALGKKTGRDFETPIQAHVNAQNTLKNPAAMDRIKEGLPESGPAKSLGLLSRSMEGPEAKNEFVERNLSKTGLLGNRDISQGLLAQKQQGLLKSQGLLEPFKNLNANNSESKLKTAMNARPGEQVELLRQFQDLSKMSDTDFVKAVKDLKTKNIFNGQDTQGSRKVNLFAMLGLAVVGGVTHGLLGAEAGLAGGAAVGAIADKYGPKIAKGMLDGALKIQGSPTLQKIQALEVPPQVKAALAREFADYDKGDKK